MGSHTVCRTTPSNHVRGKSIRHRGRPNVKLEDLPRDLLCTIVSKLPPKEVSRASVLSSHWRYICDLCCFRLSFSGTAGYTRDSFNERQEYCQYMQRFIDNVNAVVQKCHGKLVEEFDVKFEYDAMLVDHLNNWVNFAVSSRAKSVAVNLRPINKRRSVAVNLRPINKRRTDVDRYIFPFHLLDGGGSNMSHLQCIQLSFVSFIPPSEFRGFPSLRKLDLEFVQITIKDLQVILSSCSNLEWLSLVRCYLNCELKLDRLLSRLRHLIVIYCMVTMIELQVTKLVAFVYDGPIVPIVINQDSKLENAHIRFDRTNFRDGVCSLLNSIPSVQNLTLEVLDHRPEKKSVLNSPGKLSHLRCLQLVIELTDKDSDKLYRVVSILKAAPLIEKLEINFAPIGHICFANKGALVDKRHLQHCEYNHLTSMRMTGYKAQRGQHEFLVHVVENATVLEELIVETAIRQYDDHSYTRIDCRGKPCSERAAVHARSCLAGKLSPRVKLCVT